jgi:hypothetical protein
MHYPAPIYTIHHFWTTAGCILGQRMVPWKPKPELITEGRMVYLPFRWVLSAMWLCNIGHFQSCCPSPVLNILLEIL